MKVGGANMDFKKRAKRFESVWRLGSRSIPVTVSDVDTGKNELAEPCLSKVAPLLRKWPEIKKEAMQQLHSMGESCKTFVPDSVLICVVPKDRSSDGYVYFQFRVPLVEHLPEQELYALITGDLDGNNIAIEIDSGY
jgi:hypothetical protein